MVDSGEENAFPILDLEHDLVLTQPSNKRSVINGADAIRLPDQSDISEWAADCYVVSGHFELQRGCFYDKSLKEVF